MFGGIGARGGKKDRKQTIKNLKTKERAREQIEKEKILQQEQEKKRQRKLEETIRKEPIVPTPEKNESKEESKRVEENPPRNITIRKFGYQEEEENQKTKKVSFKEVKQEKEKNIQQEIEKEPVQKNHDLEDVITILKKLEEPIEEQEKPISLETPLPQAEILEEQIQEKRQEEKAKEKTPDFNHEDQIKVATSLKVEDKIKEEEVLELKIAEELESLLKKNRYELKNLYTELEEIEKESAYLYKVGDVEEAIEDIERLLAYLEQIKKQLEVISESYHLDDLYALDDTYFKDLIEEYKEYVKDQKIMDEKVKDLKRNEEYTSLMKKILEFEQMQLELAETLEEKKQKLEERDYELEEMQNQSLDIEKINQELESLIRDSEKYLEEIQNKVNESVEITKRTEIKMHYTMGVLARTLLLFSLLKMNPKPKANAVTAVEAMVAIDLIHKLLNPKKEKRVITEYHYQDYRSLIQNALGNIDSIFYLIQNGIREIQDLKSTLKEEWKEYEDVLPEYQELFQSMEKIEKELLEREENMNRIKENMKLQLEKNNQKVLEYEQLSTENN